MANIYSVVMFQLGPGSFGGAYETTPVPDGYIWIVRDIDIKSPGVPWTRTYGLNITDGEQAPLYVTDHHNAPGGTYSFWRGRQVLQAGDTLLITVVEAGWSIRISGYQLTAP